MQHATEYYFRLKSLRDAYDRRLLDNIPFENEDARSQWSADRCALAWSCDNIKENAFIKCYASAGIAQSTAFGHLFSGVESTGLSLYDRSGYNFINNDVGLFITKKFCPISDMMPKLLNKESYLLNRVIISDWFFGDYHVFIRDDEAHALYGEFYLDKRWYRDHVEFKMELVNLFKACSSEHANSKGKTHE